MQEYRICPGVQAKLLTVDHPQKCRLGMMGGMQLLFCVSGCLRFGTAGERVTLRPGCMCLLGPSNATKLLELELPADRFEGMTVCVDPPVADAWASCSLGLFAPDFTYVEQRLRQIGPDVSVQAGVQGEHVFRELYDSLGTQAPIYTQLKLAELFLHLAELPLEPREAAYLPRGQVELIRHLRDHLLSGNAAYDTLESLAAEHHISVSYLQKTFKAVYGIPVYAYLKRYRLERAAEALRSTERSVTDIALDAGYTNPSKFTESFRAVYGMTPSAYRKAK